MVPLAQLKTRLYSPGLGGRGGLVVTAGGEGGGVCGGGGGFGPPVSSPVQEKPTPILQQKLTLKSRSASSGAN